MVVARIAREELLWEIYSVLPSQETCVAMGGKAARIVVVGVPAVMSAKVGCHTCWIEQQSLVLQVEQWQILWIQGCSWGKPNIK